MRKDIQSINEAFDKVVKDKMYIGILTKFDEGMFEVHPLNKELSDKFAHAAKWGEKLDTDIFVDTNENIMVLCNSKEDILGKINNLFSEK